MIKILHIVPAIPYGGAQRSVAQLAGQQRRRGADARILTLYQDETLAGFIEHQEVPYYTTGTHSALDIGAWIRLARLVNKIGPDIIHLHLALFWNLLIISLPRMKKCLIVYHARDFSPVKPDLKDRLIMWLLRFKADAVIGNSMAVTRDMNKYLGPGIPVYRTIYNGIYLPDATVVAKDFPDSKNNNSQGRPLIGMATRFDHDKGIKEFIEAIPPILHYLPNARFSLAGKGPILAWAKEYSASLGLSNILTFPGFIDQTPQFWSSLDFALFTAPHEAFGLRVIEPQATDTVVAGYLTGGGSDEIIIAGETGVLVPWGDRDGLAREMAALWADQERYTRMARAARQRLEEHFNIEKTASRCLDLYEELLALPRTS